MSITRRGTRRIEVGGAVYAWRVRRRATYAQGLGESSMLVAIQRVTPPGRCVLVLDLAVTRPDQWCVPHQTALRPSHVASGIAAALAAGWEPEGAGQFRARHPLIRDRS